MNKFPCCHARLPSGRRRVTKVASGLLSGIALILMPKCPVCMAAYVALITGISVSTAAAGHLQTMIMVVCVGVLVFLFLSRITSVRRWKMIRPHQRP